MLLCGEIPRFPVPLDDRGVVTWDRDGGEVDGSDVGVFCLEPLDLVEGIEDKFLVSFVPSLSTIEASFVVSGSSCVREPRGKTVLREGWIIVVVAVFALACAAS